MVNNKTDALDRKVIPVTDWPQFHPWPTIAGLRHLVFHAKTNGFDSVIRRAGRRVLIKEAAFFEWLDGQTQRGI